MPRLPFKSRKKLPPGSVDQFRSNTNSDGVFLIDVPSRFA
jgi:hypothetical protein